MNVIACIHFMLYHLCFPYLGQLHSTNLYLLPSAANDSRLSVHWE